MKELLTLFRDWKMCSTHRRRRNRLTKMVLSCGVVVMVCLWVVVPLVFHFSPSLQRFFIFLNTVGNNIELDKPQELGLPGTRTFHLITAPGVSIGLWHILPESLIHAAPAKADVRDAWFESSLSDLRPVVIYLHGNKGSRGQAHRVDMYATLRRQDYHIITLDYRGYGDSSAVTPSESGLVADAKAVFTYVRDKSGTSPIIMWGHSLGTGVSCHAADDLCSDLKCPHALVLEAPFNNIQEEIKVNPLSQLFKHLPYFDWAFVSPLKHIDAEFRSDAHIRQVTCPILMLHAQDDHVIPIHLARKLEKSARQDRPPDAGPIKFVEFNASLGLGHLNIHCAPQFSALVKQFVERVSKGDAKY